MPPRPMGYPMPAGVKMPPRPAGVPPMGMPPPGVAPVPPQMPAAVPQVPVPVESENEWEEEEEQPAVDENGYIDDLEDEEEPEPEEEEVHPKKKHSGVYEQSMASDLGLPPSFVKTKVLIPLFLLFTILGGVAGYFGALFQNQGVNELPGVVHNAEIPKGRPRCGIAQKGQGCVLYLMNAQRREIEAKDFFEMAASVLGVPKFQIETANIRYATTRIPPGYIALLNIPPTQ